MNSTTAAAARTLRALAWLGLLHAVVLSVSCAFATEPAPPAKSPRVTLAAFSGLPEGLSFPELIRQVGEPHEDIGSGLHIYRYPLADGSFVLVGTPDRQRILYITHLSGAARTQLFPRKA